MVKKNGTFLTLLAESEKSFGNIILSKKKKSKTQEKGQNVFHVHPDHP